MLKDIYEKKIKKASFKKEKGISIPQHRNSQREWVDHKIRHPSYVFLEKGNIYIYISITHSDSVKNAIVIKLKKNPNPQDKRESYRIMEIKEDTKDKFSKRLKKWVMDCEDDNDIREEYKKR